MKTELHLMILFKVIIFSILLIYNSINLYSQDNLGVKIGLGISNLSKSYKNETELGDRKSIFSKNNNPAFADNFGMYYLVNISNKSIIGFEFLINTARDRRKVKYDEIFLNGTVITETNYLEKKNITYFRIPLYYGYKFQKISINGGINAMFALRSKGREKGESISNGEISVIDRKEKKLKIYGYDYGLSVGLTYYYSEEFNFELNYYYGLKNLPLLMSNEKWKNRQLLIGISYNLM